jgi:hypothetical protein
MKTRGAQVKGSRFLAFGVVFISMLCLVPGAAQASSANDFMTINSQPGDPLLNGGQRNYTPVDTLFDARLEPAPNEVVVSVYQPTTGENWLVELAAPLGSSLAIGTYADAVRPDLRGSGQPGLAIIPNGAYCDQVSGTFTVLDAALGPQTYVQTIHATFTQYCNGATAPLQGEVLVMKPTPPAELAITISVRSIGSFDKLSGAATLRGTVTCTVAAPVRIGGGLVQRVNRTVLAQGYLSGGVDCVPPGVSWEGRVLPISSVPFGGGPAQITPIAQAADPFFGNYLFVTGPDTRVVLSGGR